MNKKLISKIYKWLIQLSMKTKSNLMKKWAEDINRHFSKEDIYTDGHPAHIKMLSTANHQRNANQNTMRYHCTPVRMVIIKKTANNKCWQGHGEKGTLVHY